MADLQVDAQIHGLTAEAVEISKAADQMGFDGIWPHEAFHEPFLPLPLVSEYTDLQFGTRIALAFSRSPMLLAYLGWDLANYSDGRFYLGIGTQVGAHIRRRFSMDYEPPGPRLREYVESIQHIWDVFQGEVDELDYEGEFYSFSLLPEYFNPGPIDHPDIPIYLAGMNEYNVSVAGELADGIVLHPFNTPSYTNDVIQGYLEQGAERGERSVDDVTISVCPPVITGETEAEVAENREDTRQQIAFYGSTPSYHTVFEHHGWEDTGEKLHELSREGRWGDMPELISDEMLDTFAIEAPVDSLAAEIDRKYGDVADRVMLDDFGGEAYWEDVVSDLKRE